MPEVLQCWKIKIGGNLAGKHLTNTVTELATHTQTHTHTHTHTLNVYLYLVSVFWTELLL